jgi:hypothetical protein
MRTPRVLLFAASALAFAACNPFHRDPVVEVSRDSNQNSRWRAALVTPADLAGAVQIKGSAAMVPDGNRDKTRVSLDVSNATPGGVHPWQLHRGQCGSDEGMVGNADQYKSIKINDDGRATGSATLEFETPSTGNYYVSVGASGANPQTIVACGNLAPPTS